MFFLRLTYDVLAWRVVRIVLIQLFLQIWLLGSLAHMFLLRASDNMVLRLILACGGVITIGRRLTHRLGQAGSTCGARGNCTSSDTRSRPRGLVGLSS